MKNTVDFLVKTYLISMPKLFEIIGFLFVLYYFAPKDYNNKIIVFIGVPIAYFILRNECLKYLLKKYYISNIESFFNKDISELYKTNDVFVFDTGIVSKNNIAFLEKIKSTIKNKSIVENENNILRNKLFYFLENESFYLESFIVGNKFFNLDKKEEKEILKTALSEFIWNKYQIKGFTVY